MNDHNYLFSKLFLTRGAVSPNARVGAWTSFSWFFFWEMSTVLCTRNGGAPDCDKKNTFFPLRWRNRTVSAYWSFL